jgi:hypothetical protein
MQEAEATLREAFALPAVSLPEFLAKASWPLFLVARGRPEEALAASAMLTGFPFECAGISGKLTTADALLALGRPAAARDAVNAAVRDMRSAGSGPEKLLVQVQMIQGEMLLRTRDPKGRQLLRDVARRSEAQTGPDAWTDALFNVERVARIASELKESALASELAAVMKRLDPLYPGTHYAAALAADLDGDVEAARRGYGAAVAGWRGADTGLPELIHARERLAVLASRRGHRSNP